MILADKIIILRKKNGMSQEDLAGKLNVSRQSVSKWESAQSIPDLDKIIQMSSIFGVSTDFLLKDEIEIEDACAPIDEEPDKETRKVTMEDANDFIARRHKNALRIAIGVLLCILSPVTLIILAGVTEAFEYKDFISVNVECAIGLITMFIFVAVAVGLFLVSGNYTREYEYITTKAFETEYGVTGMVKQRKKEYQGTYNAMNTTGIIICIISVIPLFIGLFTENELFAVISVGILMGIAALGVFLIVYAGCKMGAYVALLQEGEYTKQAKEKNPLFAAITSAYWLIATVVYLVWSFTAKAWDISWLVWVVAGVLYGALCPLLSIAFRKKDDK